MLLSVENSLVEGQAALFKSIQQEINIRDITICRLPFHMLAGTDTTRQAIYFRTTITAGDYNRFVVSNTERLEKAFMDDLPHCREITREDYHSRRLWMRLKEQMCRLLSPLL